MNQEIAGAATAETLGTRASVTIDGILHTTLRRTIRIKAKTKSGGKPPFLTAS